jgi:hypothetical protein
LFQTRLLTPGSETTICHLFCSRHKEIFSGPWCPAGPETGAWSVDQFHENQSDRIGGIQSRRTYSLSYLPAGQTRCGWERSWEGKGGPGPPFTRGG